MCDWHVYNKLLLTYLLLDAKLASFWEMMMSALVLLQYQADTDTAMK